MLTKTQRDESALSRRSLESICESIKNDPTAGKEWQDYCKDMSGDKPEGVPLKAMLKPKPKINEGKKEKRETKLKAMLKPRPKINPNEQKKDEDEERKEKVKKEQERKEKVKKEQERKGKEKRDEPKQVLKLMSMWPTKDQHSPPAEKKDEKEKHGRTKEEEIDMKSASTPTHEENNNEKRELPMLPPLGPSSSHTYERRSTSDRSRMKPDISAQEEDNAKKAHSTPSSD